MTQLLPNARMEKKVEAVHARCSYELRKALKAEAESFGTTVSSLITQIFFVHLWRSRGEIVPSDVISSVRW